MVTVGVVLLILMVLLGVDLVLENHGTTDVMIMGQELSFDVWGLFVLGVAAGVLVVAGVQLVAAGMARDRRKAKERRQAEREAAATGAAGPTATGPTATAPTAIGSDEPTLPRRQIRDRPPAPVPTTAPQAAPGAVAPASDDPEFTPVTDVKRPRPGPFDRVVARKRDLPDQPSAAV